MNETDDAKKVVLKFFDLNTRAMAGEPVNPFELFHEEMKWTMTGNTPVARPYNSRKIFMEELVPLLASQFKQGGGYGIYPVDLIAEGNRVAVIVRGHGESQNGCLYNNIYLFFIEVRDGKFWHVYENCDGSLVNQAVYNRHLEPCRQKP